jgi:hypothetical protein
MTGVLVNGHNYSDDGTSSRDMRDGGHRTYLLPMISDTMAVIAGLTGNPITQNIVFNPGMEIDQANEGASVSLATGVPKYIVDGFLASFTNATAVVSAQRVADATTGFINSAKLTVATGATVAANDFLQFQHLIEANLLTQIGLGSAAARTVSLSWWVKSSIAPYTYGVAVQNFAQNRSYVANKTINSANVWQQDSISFLADTGGSWVTSGVAGGARLIFTAAASGAIASGTNNAWNASNVFSAAGITNTILSTNGATFQISGVKLEIGAAATQFDRRPLSLEMLLCQRYYRKTFPDGTAPAQNAGTPGALSTIAASTTAGALGLFWPFSEPMRAAPTVTTYNPSAANANWRNTTGSTDAVVNLDTASHKGVLIGEQTTALVVGNIYRIHASADARL